MSKFDKIFEAREADNIKTETKAVNKPRTKSAREKKIGPANPPIAELSPSLSNLQDVPRRGRPPAKRSDPNFIGFTTYIRKDTHLKVKIALLQEAKGRELSELVEELLLKWTKDR